MVGYFNYKYFKGALTLDLFYILKIYRLVAKVHKAFEESVFIKMDKMDRLVYCDQSRNY